MSKLRNKIRRVLNSSLLPRNHVFADAAYDAKTGKAVVGIVLKDLSDSEYKFIKASSINEAELKAVQMAKEKFPTLKVATDSAYAVAHSDPDEVYWVPRKKNIANLIVRSAMEMARSHVEHNVAT